MAVSSCNRPKLHDQRLWEHSLLEGQPRPKAKAQNLYSVFCVPERESKQFCRCMSFHVQDSVTSHSLCISHVVGVRSGRGYGDVSRSVLVCVWPCT